MPGCMEVGESEHSILGDAKVSCDNGLSTREDIPEKQQV